MNQKHLPITGFLCLLASTLLAQTKTADESPNQNTDIPVPVLAAGTTEANGDMASVVANMSEEDAVELAPFEVISEKGGMVTEYAYGPNRLVTENKNLAFTVDIFNNEYIKDRGATDLREVLALATGVAFDTNETIDAGSNLVRSAESSPSSNSRGGEFTNSVAIRTFRVDSPQRDGFRVGASVPEFGIVIGNTIDSINMDRIEVVKGPAALFYGVNVLAGAVNIIAKKPSSKPAQSFEATFGSEDYYRLAADSTGPVNRYMNYRVAAAWQTRGDWTDYKETEKLFGVAQLEWKPWSKVKIFAEISGANLESRGTGNQYLSDSSGRSQSSALFSDNMLRDFYAANPVYVGSNNDIRITGETGLRNEYNEPFRWARDIGGVPSAYRITGSDYSTTRYEHSVLLDAVIEAFDDFYIKVGGLYSRNETSEFSAQFDTISNNDSIIKFVNSSTVGFNPRLAPDLIDLSKVRHFPLPAVDRNSTELIDPFDHKYARYWWMEKPTLATSWQGRAEATYKIEHEFLFDSKVTHSFLAGISSIKDRISYVPDSASAEQALWYPADQKAIYKVRDIYDYSPLNYQGETTVLPGRWSNSPSGALYEFLAADGSTLYGKESGWQTSKLFYLGQFFAYQGKFFDRVNLIGGVRRDKHDVLETEKGVIVAEGRSDNYVRPYLTGDVRAESVFAEPIEETTVQYGVNVRTLSWLNVYYSSSQGVFPNTGQRDGNWESISPELTQSQEIGIKLDVLDNMIVGSFSYFEIDRDNATWSFDYAPAPAFYEPGNNLQTGKSVAQPFRIDNDIQTKGVSYPVPADYWKQAGVSKALNPDGTVNASYFRVPGTRQNLPAVKEINPKWMSVYYNQLDNTFVLDDQGNKVFFRQILDAYYQDPNRERFGSPDGTAGVFYNNASVDGGRAQFVGTKTLFSDQTTGYEANLIFSPLKNRQTLQFQINYSHIERQVVGNGFSMVPAIDYASGFSYATEYDLWVVSLGREAYDDPKDPTSTNGQGINGTSLYFGSIESASLYLRYKFTEGIFKNLSINFASKYNGPAQTSIPVGGVTLRENTIRTPDVPAYWIFDAGLRYKFLWNDYQFTLGFNVSNLFDHRKSEAVATYQTVWDDLTPKTEYRRIEVYHTPRAYRLSLQMEF